MSDSNISLSQLESYLLEAANILRGPVDAADFKTYVFPLLFFKRISDVYDEEYAIALEESTWMKNTPHFPRITVSRFLPGATGPMSVLSPARWALRSRRPCVESKRPIPKRFTESLATLSGQIRSDFRIRSSAIFSNTSPGSHWATQRHRPTFSANHMSTS